MGQGNKSSFKCRGHMTKMAMPIYGKNLKKIFFSRTEQPMILKLGMQHQLLEHYQIPSIVDPILWQGQIWSLMLLYGKS